MSVASRFHNGCSIPSPESDGARKDDVQLVIFVCFSFGFRAGWVRGRAPGLQKFAAVIPKVLFWGSGLTVQKYAGETRTKLDGLQCIWRHCYIGSKRALPTGVLGR